jgi:hypothetical protein
MGKVSGEKARRRRDNSARPSQNVKPAASAAVLALGALVPLLVLYLSCFKRSLIDDAFITLQYASTLRHHLHWGFFPGAVTNTATSPLNVVLTALTGAVAPDMVDAAIWLASAEMLTLAVLLGVLSRRIFGDYYFGLLAFLGTIANPLLMSTIGLETLLYVTLMAAALCLLVLRRWPGLAVCLALLTLTRPDGVLLFAVVLVLASPGRDEEQAPARGTARQVATRASWWRGRLRFALIYALCLLPWYLFAWIHLGSLLPDTFFLKVGNPWNALTFARGFSLYLSRYPWETLLSLILVPFIPLWLLRGDRELSPVSLLMRVLCVYAVVYYAGYALLGPGPYHWYYGPPVTAGAWMGTLALATQYHRGARLSGLARAALLAVPGLVVLGMATHFLRAGAFPPAEAPIHTNWATHDQYREIGLWLRDRTAPTTKIRLQGEVGTLAFYSQRRLIETFSCRSELEPLLRRFDTRGGIVGLLTRLNFFWFGRQQPCGPFDEYLVGSPRPVDTAALPGVVRSWRTSTKWIADGVVMLVHQ